MQRKFVSAWINTCSTIVVLHGGRVFSSHPPFSWTLRQSPMFWLQTAIPYFLLSLSRNHKMHPINILTPPDTEWFLVSQVWFSLFQYRYLMSVNSSCFSFMISLNKSFQKAPSQLSALHIYCRPPCNPQFYHIIIIAYIPLTIETLNNCETCSILCIEGTCLIF